MKHSFSLAIAATILLSCSAARAAEDEAGQPEAENREQLREEMSQARRELAEAARRVAELGRELGAEAGEEFAFRLLAPDAPRHAMLGIAVRHEEGNGEEQDGVEVLSVTPGGPADTAGIQAGDVITRVGETDLAGVESPAEMLVDAVAKLEPGDVVTVAYRRGDDERSADVTVEAFHRRMHVFGARGPLPELPRPPVFFELMRGWGDIELVPVSEQLGEYFGTDEGLLVVRAPEAEEFKLRDGDVILAIGGRKPEGPAHAMRILRSYRGGEQLELEIMRKGDEMTLEIVVPERRASEAPFMTREVVVERVAPE